MTHCYDTFLWETKFLRLQIPISPVWGQNSLKEIILNQKDLSSLYATSKAESRYPQLDLEKTAIDPALRIIEKLQTTNAQYLIHMGRFQYKLTESNYITKKLFMQFSTKKGKQINQIICHDMVSPYHHYLKRSKRKLLNSNKTKKVWANF